MELLLLLFMFVIVESINNLYFSWSSAANSTAGCSNHVSMITLYFLHCPVVPAVVVVPAGPMVVLPAGPMVVLPAGPMVVLPADPMVVLPAGPMVVLPTGPMVEVLPAGPIVVVDRSQVVWSI